MSAFVYLLTHRAAPRLKIGKAGNLVVRARQLGQRRFDFGSSLALRVGDDSAAQNLERLLHRAFAQWRIAPADLVRDEDESTDGDTEWFHLACKERLLQFLEANRDLLGFEYVGASEISALFAPRLKIVPDAKPAKPANPAKRAPPASVKLTRAERDEKIRQTAAADAVAVRDLVQGMLEPLQSLVDASAHIELIPSSECKASALLRGWCPPSHANIVSEHIHRLVTTSFSGNNGGFGLAPSATSQTRDDGTMLFELSLIWPGAAGSWATFEIAAGAIAQLPLDIPGWPTNRRRSHPNACDRLAA